jgi:hypothetical protein
VREPGGRRHGPRPHFPAPPRALAELSEVRRQLITAGACTVDLVSRRSPFQQQVLKALHVDTQPGTRPTSPEQVVAKTIRRRFLNLPGRMTRGARRRQLHLPTKWPWAEQWTACFERLCALRS